MSARGQENRSTKKWQASSSMPKAQATAPSHTNRSVHRVGNTVFILLLGWKEKEIERQTDSTGIWQMPGFPLLLDAWRPAGISASIWDVAFHSHCGKRQKTHPQQAQLLSPDTCHERVPGETGGWITAAPTQGLRCQVQGEQEVNKSAL